MLNGRINRKTFIIANIVALAILGAISFIIVVPVALLDIVIKNSVADYIFHLLYYIVAFPALLYVIYLSVIMVRRAHDIGLPGLLMVIGFFAGLIAGKLFDIHYFNLLALVVMLALALVPGNKTRNHFGPAPHSKFKFTTLKINT